MELKDGGNNARRTSSRSSGPASTSQKFDAMQLGQWRTTRRTNNNTEQRHAVEREREQLHRVGDNAQCTTCHSADAATNLRTRSAIRSLPADSTFEEIKA